MNATLSIVTVFFEAELDLLRLQARSFARFLDPDATKEIIVIDNCARPLSARWRKRIFHAYGPLASKVRMISHRDVGRVPPAVGWRRQQVLKLLVAGTVNTDAYIVLDAKNHLIAQTGRPTFVTGDGRILGNYYSYRSHPLRNALNASLKYFALEPESILDRFSSTSTPIILIAQEVRSLIEEVASRENRPFAEAFIRGPFTEFLLYGAWIRSREESGGHFYDEAGIPSAVVWPRGQGFEQVARTLMDARRPGARFFSVHRTALARMGRRARKLVLEFWVERDLFADSLEARRFLRGYRRRYLLAMVAKKLHERRL